MPSATFINKCKATKEYPHFKFVYDGVDSSDYVLQIEPIRRDAVMSAGGCTIRLRNDDGHWDDFYDVHTELYKDMYVGLEFTGLVETHKLFFGYVESARIIDDHTVIISCRDHISKCLENEIGDGQDEVIYNLYVEHEFTVSEIMWDLLTAYAGFDDTENDSNPDIHYTNFETWAASVDANYELGCRFSGHTVRHALTRISNLTNSAFWVNGEGKIDFVMHRAYNTSPIGDYTKAMVLPGREYCVTLEGRVNDILNHYNIQGRQARSHFMEFTGSREEFTLYGPTSYDELLVEEDMTVWHETETSSQNWTDAATGLLSRIGPPIRTFQFQTGLQGFIEDIGNQITLKNHFSAPMDEIDLGILELSLDPGSCTATITGQWLWL